MHSGIAATLIALSLGLGACDAININEYTIAPNDPNNPRANLAARPQLDVNQSCSDQITALKRELNALGSQVTRGTGVASSAPTILSVVQTLDTIQFTQLPASLRNTAVVETIFRGAKLSSAKSFRQHHWEMVQYAQALTDSQYTNVRAEEIQTFQIAAQNLYKFDNEKIAELERNPPRTLTHTNFKNFYNEMSEKVMRQTPASSDASILSGDPFWEHLKSYYSAYAAGAFVDYFGAKYAKPDISTTISDADLAFAVGVFFELVFDEAFETPIWLAIDNSHSGTISADKNSVTISSDMTKFGWRKGMSITDNLPPDSNEPGAFANNTTITGIKWTQGSSASDPGTTLVSLSTAARVSGPVSLSVSDSSKTYYPGGTANAPTSTTVFTQRHPKAISLVENAPGCGMSIRKAQAVNMLSQAFSSGASNAAGTIVGTFGGFGISFGALGKVSIGDNKAVTSVVQAVVGQVVKRLTVEATYRVLSGLPINGSATPYQMTGYFMSPNQQTPQHYTWVQYF